MTIWRNLTTARMAGLDQSISYTTRSCISCEQWDIHHNLGLLRSFFEINNCAVSKSQELAASKDISGFLARTLGLSATKHGSQVSTVLHWEACCVG